MRTRVRERYGEELKGELCHEEVESEGKQSKHGDVPSQSEMFTHSENKIGLIFKAGD